MQYTFELSKELAVIYKISDVSEAYKRGDLMQKYDMVTFSLHIIRADEMNEISIFSCINITVNDMRYAGSGTVGLKRLKK